MRVIILKLGLLQAANPNFVQMEKVVEFREGVSQTVTIPLNNVKITSRARVRMDSRDEKEKEN